MINTTKKLLVITCALCRKCTLIGTKDLLGVAYQSVLSKSLNLNAAPIASVISIENVEQEKQLMSRLGLCACKAAPNKKQMVKDILCKQTNLWL